jgi:drug/metabolite transporter (DMT)-like permease
MFWVSAINLALSSWAAVLPWQMPDGGTAIGIATVMILGPLGTYLSLWAVRFAEVSVLAPFDYTRLIVNTLAALIVFREMPDPYGWLGIAIIVAGCTAQSVRANMRVAPAVMQAKTGTG